MCRQKIDKPDGLDGFFDGFGNSLTKIILGIASFTVFSELALNQIKSIFGLDNTSWAMKIFDLIYFALPGSIIAAFA